MINIEKRKLMLGAACIFAGTASALATRGVMAVTRPVSTPITTQDPREHRRLQRLPNVPLLTHTGEAVRFYDMIKDKKVVINFMYTACSGICGPSTQNILKAQQLLGDFAKDIHFYSISMTPLSDSPAELRNYMKVQGVEKGWTFLTGMPEDITSLRRGLGMASKNPADDADLTNHVGMLRIIDEPMVAWSHASTDRKSVV